MPWQKKKEGEVTKFGVKVLTKQPKFNEKILIEVEALKPMEYFIYQLISRGKLIDSKMVVVPTRTYHVFSVPATLELLPRAEIIVYYFEEEQIVSSKVEIQIKTADVRLANFVDIKLSTNQAEPSHSVNISVYSNPKSYIGLMGVDQSVLWLKNDNDLTVDRAVTEISRYHSPGQHKNDFEDFQVNCIKSTHRHLGCMLPKINQLFAENGRHFVHKCMDTSETTSYGHLARWRLGSGCFTSSTWRCKIRVVVSF